MDAREVEDLAAQLASQVDYSNELLLQLQELEQGQLRAQQDVREKQLALRQAMAVCDSVQQDNVNLKSKLQYAQQVAQEATEEAKRNRVEAQVKAQEADALHRYSKETNEELETLRQSNAELERQAELMEKDKNQLVEQMDQLHKQHNESNARARSEYSSAQSMLNELRSKQAPVEHQLTRLKSDLEKLKSESSKQNSKIEDLEKEKQRTSKLLEQAQTTEQELQNTIETQQGTLSSALNEKETLSSQCKERQNQLEKLEQLKNDFENENKKLINELKTRDREVKLLGEDLVKQAESRGKEKEMYDLKILELQQDINRIADQAREREKQTTEEVQAQMLQSSTDRKTLQAQYNNLQQEHNRLHQVLQQLQNQHNTTRQREESTKQEGELKVQQAVRKAREMELKFDDQEKENKRQLNSVMAELQRVQTESTSRSSSFLQTTLSLQSQVQSLFTKSQEMDNRVVVNLNTVSQLSSDLQSRENLDDILIELRSWAKEQLTSLTQQNTALREQLEAAHEEQLGLCVQRDEGIAKSIVLGEELDRYKNELQQSKDRLKRMEEQDEFRENKKKKEKENLVRERGELVVETDRVKRELQEAVRLNREGAEERLRESVAYGEEKKRLNERIQQLEKEKDELEMNIRKIERDNQEIETERQMAKTTIQDLTRQLSSVQEQLNQLESVHSSSAVRSSESQSIAEKQLLSTRESLRKHQTQLTQTKNLLKVVQDQRKHLQQDNASLRAELDEVMRRAMGLDTTQRIASSPRMTSPRSNQRSPKSFAPPPPQASPGVVLGSIPSDTNDGIVSSSPRKEDNVRTTHEVHVHHHRSSITSNMSTASGFSTTPSGLSTDRNSDDLVLESVVDDDEEDDAGAELEKLRREVQALKASP